MHKEQDQRIDRRNETAPQLNTTKVRSSNSSTFLRFVVLVLRYTDDWPTSDLNLLNWEPDSSTDKKRANSENVPSFEASLESSCHVRCKVAQLN